MAESVFDELNKDIGTKKTNQMSENQNNYNPLKGETIKRDYAQQVGAVDDIPVTDRVPEAKYVQEPQPEKTASNEDDKQTIEKEKTVKKEDSQYNQPPANENMGELSKKDQIKSATMLTNAVLKAYTEAWKFLGGTQKLTDEKVIDMVVKGELSYDVLVPINSEDGEVTLGEFISTYNGTVDVSTIVTEEFINEVKDSMINEFMRMGWGITDRQNIAQAFLRDSITKGFALFKLKNTMNSILDVLKDNYKKQKEEVEEKYGVKDAEPNQPYTNGEKNHNNTQASPSFNNQTKETVRNEKVSKVPPPPPNTFKKEPKPTSPPPPPPPNIIKKQTDNIEKADINSPIVNKEIIQEKNTLGDIVQNYSIESTPLMKEERSIVETIVTNENFDEIAKEHDRLLQEQLKNNSVKEEIETNTENSETDIKAYGQDVNESEMINDSESQEIKSDFQSENEVDKENQENENQQEKSENNE